MDIWIRCIDVWIYGYLDVWIYEYIYNAGVSFISGESSISAVFSISHIKGGLHKDIYEKLHIRIYDIFPLSTLYSGVYIYLRGPTYAYM